MVNFPDNTTEFLTIAIVVVFSLEESVLYKNWSCVCDLSTKNYTLSLNVSVAIETEK